MYRLRFRVWGKTKRRKPLNLLGFQRFLPSDIFDYFALMSDLSKSLENRLPLRARGFESPILRQNRELTQQGEFFVLQKTRLGDSNAVKKQHSALFLNGDRRFLQSINYKILLLALQKSRATSPILRHKSESICFRIFLFS